MLLDVTHVPFGNTDAVAAAIRPETAAIITEPIQGEGGIHTPPAGFFAQLRSLCDTAGVLLIIDEIQTGCGRTGDFCMTEEDIADIMTLGK